MNKKVDYCYIICLTILLIGMVIIPDQIRAASDLDWEDTFDNEESLEDWYISHGNYTVNETLGTLVSGVDCYHTTGGGKDWYLNYIWRNSTPITGTWSFDLLLPINFTFFIFYYVGISAIADGSHPEAGYTFIIFPSEIKINYRYSSYNSGTLNSYSLVNDLDGWQHFDINRNETGHIWVLLNGTTILNGINTYHTVSERINIQTEPGALMDNVSYTAFEEVPPHTSPFLTPLLCLLSLIALLIFRRRSKNLKSHLD